MSYAWENRVVGQGSLSQQIYTLRQILFDGRNQIIQTLPRRGYLFNPQYLHDAALPEPLPTVVAPATKRTVVFELPKPNPRPATDPALSKRPRSSLRTAMLAGIPLLLLSGLVILGERFANASSDSSVTHKHQVGQLEVLYVETNQRMLDALVKETEAAVQKLSAMTDKPAQVVVNLSPGFYEIHCVQADSVNWLKVHKDQIRTATTEYLQECLR